MIPTEPIGSIPRPPELIAAMAEFRAGRLAYTEIEPLYAAAVADTVRRFEATGSPVITDGEQRKSHNFASYCVDGLPNFVNDGFHLRFVGHERVWPRLTSGPFAFMRRGAEFLAETQRLSNRQAKQAVISPSAVSLFYPARELPDYSRDAFIEDLLREHESDIRSCLEMGAHTVQVDFTEGRLAGKLDPSGGLLNSFIGLNNLALARFNSVERRRIGVHTCPGGDRDSTHSADVDYSALLPSLFELMAGRFFIALAREPDRRRVLALVARYLKPEQVAYVGVIDPLDPRVETPEEVRDRVLEAAEYIPLSQLGTTDDCGFAPFSDDLSTSRETAFAKIEARVVGTRMASQQLEARWSLQ
ncbi:MAG: cobalamin-independent methionine synthase II family protein [Burkholderiales bacterium]|nr:cobalamin-independent methionine synthase II family protein [Burkholderiales bacterium]MDE2396639.1 cobalamin-independent methionine synthase II family protein [Burkholderiales bacterium]MDE2457370.1 cobalamin-independent methionine synthase II family protein [Burkholderiales bacterium]